MPRGCIAVSLGFRSRSRGPRHRLCVKQAVKIFFSGCDRGDPKAANGDCSFGRFDSARQSFPGSASSCSGTSFRASNSGACGFLQAFPGAVQETCAACARGDRQSLRAESSVRPTVVSPKVSELQAKIDALVSERVLSPLVLSVSKIFYPSPLPTSRILQPCEANAIASCAMQ